MRNSNRNAKVLAVLAAAAGMTGSLQFARATPPSFSWRTSTSGNWSGSLNWAGSTAPNGGGATNYDLTFANAGAAYTATNDLGSFNLETIRFAPGSANAINIAGAQLNFTGDGLAPGMVFSGAGTGTVNIANALSLGGNAGSFSGAVGTFTGAGNYQTNFNAAITSTVAPLADVGAALDWNKTGGQGNINAGASLYAIRVEQGSMVQAGNTVQLFSGQRENDVLGGPGSLTGSNEGYWSLGIGTVPGQTGSYTVNNGTIISESMCVSVNQLANGVFTMNNSTGTFLARSGTYPADASASAGPTARSTSSTTRTSRPACSISVVRPTLTTARATACASSTTTARSAPT